MNPKLLPTEFAINMMLEKMLLLQQSELKEVNNLHYFDESNPCHIYFICRRPRLSIDPKKFSVTEKKISITVYEHKQDEKIEYQFDFRNNLKSTNVELRTEYPYNTLQILREGEVWLDGRLSLFLQTAGHISEDFFDLEVLYVGQSYGVDGARTAPDRLINHKTLQSIYAEAINNNPDSEIWLALASFSQINIMFMNGRIKFTEEELEQDKERAISVHNKVNFEGINEQQKINFTEAALIKYFQPKYNIIYKDTFPNPAHSTYSECYDLDINSICIELHTKEMLNVRLYSDSVQRKNFHMKDFLLHSNEDRKSMFNFFEA